MHIYPTSVNNDFDEHKSYSDEVINPNDYDKPKGNLDVVVISNPTIDITDYC